MAKKILTYNLSEPLNGATTAKVDIYMVDGNLVIDGNTGGEPVLASGILEYLENQQQPARLVSMNNGQAAFTLNASGKGQPWFRFPWAACNAATAWQIHLNPTLSFEITAHTGGGNVHLNLTGMGITRLKADTGGGNLQVTLPDNVAGLNLDARSGAGNVVVQVPGGIEARIHATSGLGKVILDPRFNKVDEHTYQSSEYDTAAEKIDMTLTSGAGNVIVEERITEHEETAVRN